ncbi:MULTISPECIES: tetratricopeptide repeat-containing sensor histidine kinase [Chitinophaga]|uniref:tetratricopeptide repeat-containing sensor histidine kinase n=1 Tax=Chitinophaga TaxID=79328 RepID=UPI0014550C35|nr:histidine kinase [Chitinophaga ginsengisegetis]MDR6569116.1 tetratricopeptide (TPR) repeat protein [Chitinophaga ginsengisegetis]MDR6648855.1 tetratricopeptide (TPR) repeat protein [Chitinophaga ginsengisegetis]MDR6655197.1 tetratricopeptide (TPR) repeat protein [Chitinophaga ginsengisegetis]
MSAATAQDSAGGKRGTFPVSKAAKALRKSLSNNDDELQTAGKYEALAKELTDKSEYAKAEEYLKKALDIYTRLNHKDAAAAGRALAKVQEMQNKIIPAIQNYQSAGDVAIDKSLVNINLNDANRLRNNSNPRAQTNYAQSNVDIIEKTGKKEEAADAYKQLGNSLLLENNTSDAIASYRKAIEKTDNTREIADISKKISKVYVEGNNIDAAIRMNEAILEKAKQEDNIELQIDQVRELAQLYTTKNLPGKTGSLLEEAYALAFKSGNTSKTKDCLLALTRYYREQQKEAVAMTRYDDFLHRLDTLIRTDSSLVDASLFDITEGKIKDLEREKELQLALISNKNKLNYFLIASILAMVVLLFFIVRSLYAIKIKNKKIALQSLRREMNPHFIFNSLNSVNQYIAENKEVEANKYLTSYSGLMRNVMEHSNKDFVPLSTEIEQLKSYLDLEQLRFSDKFIYILDIDEALDTDAVMIPNMLIQPHLENAVWHGLRYKATKGLLRVTFQKQAQFIQVVIEDDGIGLTESRKLKTIHQKAYQSRGITNTTERISLLNDIYHLHIRLQMEEITLEGATGTRVVLQLPLMDKK